MSTLPPFLAVILLGIVIVLALAEFHSLKYWNSHIRIQFEIDMRLTEPEEAATLSYQIINTAFWPMPAVSAAFLFDDAVKVLEEWEDGKENYTRSLFNVDTSLLPQHACHGTVRLCFRERGRHALGKVYLETGDFLGLRSVIRSMDIPITVVCTAKPVEDQGLDKPLGGLLGDISVRRFIFEDPGMILSYREYTGSEPLKAVSWLQSAHTGRLMVKQYDHTVNTDVAVLVDIEAGKKTDTEYCLSLVRTVCDELERRQIPYAVLSNGDLQSRKNGVGRVHCFEV